jgi:hypothetical protein
MIQSADSNSSEMVNIRVSRATQEKLNKLKKGDMTYDDVISSAVSGENWDVEKIDADCAKAIKNTKRLHSHEEVFG